MCSQWGAALLATPRVRLKSKPGGRVHIQMVTRRSGAALQDVSDGCYKGIECYQFQRFYATDVIGRSATQLGLHATK